jgi:hypothetical protein
LRDAEEKKMTSRGLLKVNKRITDSTCTFQIVFEERRDLDIQRLRQETEADHHNVEGVPLMHQGLNTAEYVQCLQRIYGVVAAGEERAAKVAPEWLQPALLARQRRPLLELELAWFGVTERDNGRPTLPEMNKIQQ